MNTIDTEKFAVVMVAIIAVGISIPSCVLGKESMDIGEEKHLEYLARLNRLYGENNYYYLSSHKSLVEPNRSWRESVIKYAEEKISDKNICKSGFILDESGSWTNERGDIYINFFCKPR